VLVGDGGILCRKEEKCKRTLLARMLAGEGVWHEKKNCVSELVREMC
jgi:hypothetical protein